MSTILILAVILLYSFQTLFCKMFTDRYPGKPELASPVFGALEGVFIFLLSWVWQGFRFQADTLTLLLGIGNAAILLGYNTFLIKASSRGSYAFMNVMLLFGGILVPIYWTCADEDSAFEFFTNDGEPLELGVGNTYIAICSYDSEITYEEVIPPETEPPTEAPTEPAETVEETISETAAETSAETLSVDETEDCAG